MLSKEKKTNKFPPTKPVKFTKLPLPQLPPRLSKEVLEKLKFHRKNAFGKEKKTTEIAKLSYVQVLLKSVNNILKIKEKFPELYYDLDSGLSKRYTLVLSNTRELDRELFTK